MFVCAAVVSCAFVYYPWNDDDVCSPETKHAATGNGKKPLFVRFVWRSVRRRPPSSSTAILQKLVRQVYGARDDQVSELCRHGLDRHRPIQHRRFAAAGNKTNKKNNEVRFFFFSFRVRDLSICIILFVYHSRYILVPRRIFPRYWLTSEK